jgi:glycosyltransferase involved in cell wall biosynthesis
LRYPDIAAGHLVIIHAFYFGKAVIAARTVGTVEHIEDDVNGVLYQPGNARELAHKIRELMDSRETWERIKAKATQSSKRYTQEQFVQNVLSMTTAVLV